MTGNYGPRGADADEFRPLRGARPTHGGLGPPRSREHTARRASRIAPVVAMPLADVLGLAAAIGVGADMARVRTVYNGVDPADFPPLEGEPEVPTISWVGRVDPVKDLETLLLAFALVHRAMPEARLRMFGSPPQGQEAYLERCRGLAAELGISEAATFEGRVAEIRDAYSAGQVYVLCSIAEGFPYTVIEAMTCGRPCVATDVGGVNEAVADTGIVVPPRSPESLAQACLTLLQDGPRRRRLGAAARMRALEYFTVDRAISAFDEIYTFVGTGLELPTVEPEDESDDLIETDLPERDEETELLEATG